MGFDSLMLTGRTKSGCFQAGLGWFTAPDSGCRGFGQLLVCILFICCECYLGLRWLGITNVNTQNSSWPSAWALSFPPASAATGPGFSLLLLRKPSLLAYCP